MEMQCDGLVKKNKKGWLDCVIKYHVMLLGLLTIPIEIVCALKWQQSGSWIVQQIAYLHNKDSNITI
eukprot:scaffold15605_cov37-Attheya_sp.AAC.4